MIWTICNQFLCWMHQYDPILIMLVLVASAPLPQDYIHSVSSNNSGCYSPVSSYITYIILTLISWILSCTTSLIIHPVLSCTSHSVVTLSFLLHIAPAWRMSIDLWGRCASHICHRVYTKSVASGICLSVGYFWGRNVVKWDFCQVGGISAISHHSNAGTYHLP